ncbi:hypothetical protein EBT16_03260 [bacterium]|nr:hypothetical protein [bacterium]
MEIGAGTSAGIFLLISMIANNDKEKPKTALKAMAIWPSSVIPGKWTEACHKRAVLIKEVQSPQASLRTKNRAFRLKLKSKRQKGMERASAVS